MFTAAYSGLYDAEKTALLGLEIQRPNGSPARSLLHDMGIQNFTVRNLYDVLSKAERKKEMAFLEEYGKC